MNALCIEDSQFGFEWFKRICPIGWVIVSSGGNRNMLSTLYKLSADGYGRIIALLDYVDDNAVLYDIHSELKVRCPARVEMLTYPCFEWAVLSSGCGKRMFVNTEVRDAYLANCNKFRLSPTLVNIIDDVYGVGNSKSSEKLAKRLLMNYMATCAYANSKRIGNYWMSNCDCTGASTHCYPAMLAVKDSYILQQTGVSFNEYSVPQSMIDNYGSYELALQHLKEIGVI